MAIIKCILAEQGGKGGGSAVQVSSIVVTTPPNKTSYIAGETFDPTGMVVTASYTIDGVPFNQAEVTGTCTFTPSPLTDGITAVTISYTDGNGTTVTTSQPITIVPRLASIAVTTLPTKVTYEYEDNLVTDGIVVTATYSDNHTNIVTPNSYSPTTLNTVGTQAVTVSYTENGVTETTTFDVTVDRKTIPIPTWKGTLTYNGSQQSADNTSLWNNYTNNMTIDETYIGTDAGDYNATFIPKANYRWPDGTTTAKTVTWSISKAAGNISLSKTSVTLNASKLTDTVTVTRLGDGAISVSSSDPSIATVSIDGTTITISHVNQTTGTAVVTVEVAEGTNYLAATDKTINVAAQFVAIYGVEWDWTSSGPTRGTRTDAAVGFSDPNPAVNNGTGSSPFDNIMPWAGMVKETRTGGVMVKEPKYWFKWTKTGKKLKLQIANYPAEGFHVDPVNMDRDDRIGELDFSYIGRYHCSANNWKSETNVAQKCQITRSAARSGIHGLGANIWQMDFAQMWYVGMLYLVEFADWNGQATIGYGCSAGGSKENNGRTDAMSYHTGTTAANRETYGYTQYRNIEGWWDNVMDWMDGCYYTPYTSLINLNIILNPSQYSDDSNGTLIGSIPDTGGSVKYPNDMEIPTQSGFEWALRPTSLNGNSIQYVPDGWTTHVMGLSCLSHGGSSYSKSLSYGPFHAESNSTTSVSDNIGCRLWERPPKVSYVD